jgi:hypothetical protein
VSASFPPLSPLTLAGTNVKAQRIHIGTCANAISFGSVTSGIVYESVTAGTWTNPGSAVLGQRDPIYLRGFTAWGPNTFLSAGYGQIFMDYFTSNTQGAIHFMGNMPSARNTAFVTNSWANVQGTGYLGDGTLSMDTVGDYTIIEMPYFVKGHTSFQNVGPTLNGTSTGNFTYQYQLDTGSGYGGTWKTVSGANLSAETISAAGFRLKLKITVATASASSAIGNVIILTNTTVAAQAANPYPLDTVTLAFTNLIAGSEVRVYAGTDPVTATEIGGTESSGTTFSFSHSSGGTAGVIAIFAMGYQPIYLPYTFKSTDDSILIQQVVDRNYVNP